MVLLTYISKYDRYHRLIKKNKQEIKRILNSAALLLIGLVASVLGVGMFGKDSLFYLLLFSFSLIFFSLYLIDIILKK